MEKEEFFKKHNPLLIDEKDIPNWENEKYNYYVIEHSKDYRYVLTVVYNKTPLKVETILLYEDGQPIKQFSSLESAYTLYTVLTRSRLLV